MVHRRLSTIGSISSNVLCPANIVAKQWASSDQCGGPMCNVRPSDYCGGPHLTGMVGQCVRPDQPPPSEQLGAGWDALSAHPSSQTFCFQRWFARLLLWLRALFVCWLTRGQPSQFFVGDLHSAQALYTIQHYSVFVFKAYSLFFILGLFGGLLKRGKTLFFVNLNTQYFWSCTYVCLFFFW